MDKCPRSNTITKPNNCVLRCSNSDHRSSANLPSFESGPNPAHNGSRKLNVNHAMHLAMAESPREKNDTPSVPGVIKFEHLRLLTNTITFQELQARSNLAHAIVHTLQSPCLKRFCRHRIWNTQHSCWTTLAAFILANVIAKVCNLIFSQVSPKTQCTTA